MDNVKGFGREGNRRVIENVAGDDGQDFASNEFFSGTDGFVAGLLLKAIDSKTMTERERQGEIERETETETDRQRERERETERHTHRESETEKQRQTETERRGKK